MTLQEFKEKLADAKEHYQIVDSFVKDYRQSMKNRNGYVYFAKINNRVIDKSIGEPNQKWHFFDSYLGRAEYKDLTDAKLIYNRLKCPELLLWIAEAVGIEKEIVKEAAKEAAKIIDAGSNGRARNRAGDLIRKKYFTWETIEKKMLEDL